MKNFFLSIKNVVLQLVNRVIFKIAIYALLPHSSGKQKGKKSGGKEKPKNIKSNTGAEELPEVWTFLDGFILLSLIKQ